MIFFVEDDDNIRELVIYTLQNSNMKTAGFPSPELFWKAMENSAPDLILLDIMLPGEDGLSVLRKLKGSSATKNIPVILLTAKGSEIDKVKGFDMGADDYITKPFGMMEMLARVKAVLRRTSSSPSKNADYEVGNMYVSPKKHTVQVDGKNVILTLKEFKMLCYLLENRSIVLTREQILNEIWGYAFTGETRTIDVHIRTLRQKLGTAGNMIETVRGIGYRISEDSNG